MNIKEATKLLYGWQECDVCHRIGPDVRLRPVVKYQAGAGVTQILQCEDVTACWVRKDEEDVHA